MRVIISVIVFVLWFTIPATAELYDVGSGVLYDSTYDMTWLGDAGASGRDHFAETSLWIEENQHLGFNDWRLPTIDELLHMHREYYVGEERTIIGFAGYEFWSSDPVAENAEDMWIYTFTDTWNEGESPLISAYNKEINTSYGWAVADGNLVGAPVPIPSAFWLLGSGLVVLIGIRKKFKR